MRASIRMSGNGEHAIYIQGAATDTVYLNPVPTPDTSPIPPGDDPFGIIYMTEGDPLSPVAGHPYYREPGDGPTHDLLKPDLFNTGTFITVVPEPELLESRRLAAGTRMTITDGGAQGPITVSVDAATDAFLNTLNVATFVTAVTEAGLQNSRRLAVGTRLTLTDGGAQGPITVSVDAATNTLLNTLNAGPYITAVASPGLPNSRKLDVSTRLTIVDSGPQGLVTVAVDPATDVFLTNLSTTQLLARFPVGPLPNVWQLDAGPNITINPTSLNPNIVTPKLVVTPVVHTMHWDFTDGVIPIPDAFTNNFTFYKFGPLVLALMGGTNGFTSPSILPSQIQTRAGTEIPVGFRPISPAPLNQACSFIQNIVIAGIPVPPLTSVADNVCAFDAFGTVAPNITGIAGVPGAPERTWFPLNIIDWPPQFYVWIAAP